MKQLRISLMLLSVGFIALGVFLLVRPAESINMVCILFGALIALSGIVNILRYIFNKNDRSLYAQFTFVLSILYICIGALLVLHPDFIINMLVLVFALFIALDGIIRLISSIQLARAGGGKWWIHTLLSLVSLGLAALLVWLGRDGFDAVVMLMGILLVAEGCLNLTSSAVVVTELHTMERVAAQLAAAQAAALDTRAPADVEGTATEVPADVPAASAAAEPAEEASAENAGAATEDASSDDLPEQDASRMEL